VISDYFTKWTQAFPIPNQTAATVADTLVTNCFSLFGVPRWLHSDQGTNFESELFQELCKLLDIHKTRTLAYHPQSDGQVERFNRTCKQMLKTFVNENMTDWDDHLPLLLMAYRATPHESTGLSPNLMMFGDECALPLDVMVKAPPRQRHVCQTEYVEWLRQSLGKAHELARRHLKVSAKRQKRYDCKARPHKYRVGSYVWHWYDPAAAKKFGCGWTYPYRVVDCPTETIVSSKRHQGSPPAGSM
jgi:transposase InsO family protein